MGFWYFVSFCHDLTILVTCQIIFLFLYTGLKRLFLSFLIKLNIRLIPDSSSFHTTGYKAILKWFALWKWATRKWFHIWNFNGGIEFSFALCHHYSFQNNCFTDTKLFVAEVRPLFSIKPKDIFSFWSVATDFELTENSELIYNALAGLSYHPAKASCHGFLNLLFTVWKVLVMGY